MKLDRLLKIKEIAVIANVEKTTPYRWIYRGELPAVYLGRNVRVREEDFLKFMRSKRVET